MSDRDRQGSSGGRERSDVSSAEVTEEASADQQLFELRTRVARHKRSLQRKAEREAKANVAPPAGGGATLGTDVRSRMERQLGADLSSVRIHTSTESADAAATLGAKAFTDGSDVHFGHGQFAPGSKEGDRLLAHELTHVVQGQKAGIQRKKLEHDADEAEAGDVEVSHPGDASEQEADHVADGVTERLHDGNEDSKSADGGATTAGDGHASRAPQIGAKPSPIGRKIFRAASTQPEAKKPGLFGRLFGGGKKVGAPAAGQAKKDEHQIPQEAAQIDPLVKNVRELLDRPIPPETKKDLEKQWQELEKAAADLKKALAAADPALAKQAEAEVDAIRMQASGTVQGKHGAKGGGGAADLAKANWQKASAMVKGWATSGVPISIDGLQKINEVLGAGLENNGGTPGEVRKKEVMTEAPGGAPNFYLLPKTVPAELAAAVAWYQANRTKMKGPELAAKMYQRLVSIHPFMDANGRTCRLAMDWVLESHGLPPAALQGDEVNVAVFGMDPMAGRDSVAPDHAEKAVTAGIRRTIDVMKRVLGQAKK